MFNFLKLLKSRPGVTHLLTEECHCIINDLHEKQSQTTATGYFLVISKGNQL